MALRCAGRAHILAEARINPLPREVIRKASGMEAVFTFLTDEHIQIMTLYLAMSTFVQIHGVDELGASRIIPRLLRRQSF